METIRRKFKIEKQSFFLLGPRGTGKSTLIKGLFPSAVYLDLLLPDTFRSYNYPEAKKILLYRGKERLVKDGILIEPCEDFLMRL
ncbi:MAG: hypothetical protein HQL10_00480 [Nitrospirae bacterium]|nr:hypothetical protein [Nitrospirota bacterium]